MVLDYQSKNSIVAEATIQLVSLTGKHTYRLKFPEEGQRCAKELEFEARDMSQILEIAHTQSRFSTTELWQDGAYLCKIRRQPSHFWEISWTKANAD